MDKIIDIFLHLDEHLHFICSEYGMWVYGILFLIIFCETGLVVTPFLPGDSLLFAVGALAARGSMDVYVVTILLIVAAILGDFVNYRIGFYFGAKIAAKPRFFLKPEHLEKAHKFYEQYGGKAIVLARFLPIFRTIVPFVAGMGSMSYKRFGMYNIVGGIVWVVSMTACGFFFGNLPYVKENFELVVIGIIIVSLIPVFIEIGKKYFGKKTPASSGVIAEG